MVRKLKRLLEHLSRWSWSRIWLFSFVNFLYCFFAFNKCNSLPFGLIWALISFYLRDLWPTYLPSQCGLPLKHYFKKDNFLLAFHSLIPKNETSILISEIRGSNPVIGKFLYRTFLLLTVKITVEKVKINKKRLGMTHFLANNKTF